MIGQVSGILIEKVPPLLLVSVGGIAYEIEAPMTTFYKLPELHQPITLFTHFIVREDAQLLFGFYEKQDRALFRHLLKVNGVGPKLALTILSSINADQFVHTINNNDTSTLVKLPGVGKKTAERLIVEMRDRLSDWSMSVEANTVNQVKNSVEFGANKEALSALVALGFKPQIANHAISKINTVGLNSEEIIRQALKELA